MTSWRVLVGASIAMAPIAASAQSNGYDAQYARYRPSDSTIAGAHSPAYRQCMSRAGGITSNMRECSAAEFRRVDTRLNANYRSVMGRLSAPQQQQLRASQRRWLANRWTDCENSPALEGGTLDLIIIDACTLDELTRRTLWLGQLR
jgi:uncharacterized protein YecT (DUF1311 family)